MSFTATRDYRTLANDHYIAKFLTKAWEVEPGRLRYFNFRTKLFEFGWTKSLFAQEGLNSPALETFFKKKIEDIVAHERHELLRTGNALSNWRKYRAFFLLLMLQSGRVLTVHRKANQLEMLPEMTEAALDRLVLAMEEQYALVQGTILPSQRMFFPSTGLFPFWVVKPGKRVNRPEIVMCSAMPLHPQAFMAMVPRSVTLDDLAPFSNDATVMNRSVGVDPYCDRIVIHSHVYDHTPHQKLKADILGLRAGNNQMVWALNQANAIKKLFPWVK